MNILIVSSRLPHPKAKADGMTVHRLIKYLSPRHEIYLACFYNDRQQLAFLPELEKYCAAVECVRLKKWRAIFNSARGLFCQRRPLQVSYYADPEMQAAVDRLIEKHQPDLAYSHLIRTAQYVQDQADVKRVLAMQISQTLNYSRMVKHARSLFHRMLYDVEYRKVKRYEPAITRSFHSCLCISRHDKESLQGHEEIKNMFYNAHGIDVDYYTPKNGVRSEKLILFSGVMETPTNIDAILYFYETMYPLVKAQVPDARLVIIGKNPPKIVRSIPRRDPTVSVTGFVEDMRGYYEKASVGIDTLRIGAGMQNKLLTGMCMGVPMVCTSIANEGIGAEHGKHLLIADQPAEFAKAVVDLLRDEELAATIAKRARRFVEQYWTWEYHFQRFERHIEALVHGETPVHGPAVLPISHLTREQFPAEKSA